MKSGVFSTGMCGEGGATNEIFHFGLTQTICINCCMIHLLPFVIFSGNNRTKEQGVFDFLFAADRILLLTPEMGIGGGEIGTNICSIHNPR